MKSLSELPVEELADGICLRAGRIAAAEAELLPWIAEFDRREGWAGTGMLSCAHWLSWKVGLSPGAAREQVRVARRLEDLPPVASAFADGRVSYSKARAISRVADPDDGIDWVELARHSSAAQLEKIVRGMRRAQANEAAELDPEAAAWSLRTRVRYDDNGNFALTISGPAEYLPMLQAGIEAKKAELQRQREAEAADGVVAVPQHHNTAREDVSAETSAEAAGSVDRPVPAEVSDVVPATEDVLDLDEQAPGWPPGTTRRQVQEAASDFAMFQQTYTEHSAEGADELPRRVPARVAPPPTPPAESRHASAEGADVSAETAAATRVTDAEALLALTQDALNAEQAAHPAIARRRRPRLSAQIDPLSGWGRLADGELLPPSSLRAVMKTLPGRDGVLRLRPVTAADLRRHDLGRTQREGSPALRALLGTLDGERCRFPGCTRHKKLHAHHVVYWSDGGRTDLDNLVLVCARHHTLIHTQGFALELHPDRRLTVATADGMPLLHHPAQPWGDPAALAEGCGQLVSAETLPPDHLDARMDLRYVVGVLMRQAA